MKIPRKFRFLGKTWTVDYANPPEPSMPTAWAITQARNQSIVISSTLPQENKEEAFIHELLHMLMFSMGVNESCKISFEQEEAIVNMLSAGLYALIKDETINV